MSIGLWLVLVLGLRGLPKVISLDRVVRMFVLNDVEMNLEKKMLTNWDTRKCSGIENENSSYFLRKPFSFFRFWCAIC